MRYIIILVLFTSCSSGWKANWQLRRAEKLINKAEAAGLQWKRDTVYRDITVYVPSVRYDTLFKSEPNDTITITKDRLQIKYVRLPGDTVWIDGECEADTIIQKVPTYINNEIKSEKSGLPWWVYAGFAVCFIVIIRLVFKIIANSSN